MRTAELGLAFLAGALAGAVMIAALLASVVRPIAELEERRQRRADRHA